MRFYSSHTVYMKKFMIFGAGALALSVIFGAGWASGTLAPENADAPARTNIERFDDNGEHCGNSDRGNVNNGHGGGNGHGGDGYGVEFGIMLPKMPTPPRVRR